MLPDQVSNPGPLTYESGALPIALRGPAERLVKTQADLNELPFPRQRLPWINFQSFSCCDQHFFL